MNVKSFWLVPTSASICFLISACGGTGSTSVKSNTIEIKTQVTSPIASWTAAAVSGNDLDGNYPCNVSTDANCIVAVGNYGGTPGSIGTLITGSSGAATGVALLTTDALPGDWYFAAVDSVGTSTCPQGGSVTGEIGPPSPTVIITCNIGPVGMSTTPSSCTITNTTDANGNTTTASNCPANVVLTSVSGASTLPARASLQVGNFDGSGNLIMQDTPSASSSTTITVPAPKTDGTTYLAVRNSTNNKTIGVGLFTVNVKNINQNQCLPHCVN